LARSPSPNRCDGKSRQDVGGDTIAEVFSPGAATPPQRQPWYAVLYIQVLIAIALGVAIGHFYPKFGEQLNRWAMRSSR
jgi:hypothetical protein